MFFHTHLKKGFFILMLVAGCGYVSSAQDVQVNSKDNNATNLGNNTTESETWVVRKGSLAVVGYNTSRQSGLLGSASWTSLSGYAYSTNGGASFVDAGFVPSSGTFLLEGDPTLGFDSNSNLYYASLLENPSSSCSFIGVNKSTSTSPSVVFGPPVTISGPGSCSGAFEDKEFLAVDTTGGPFNGRVYVAWSEFPSIGAPQALFAASSSTSPLAFSPTITLAPSPGANQHGTIPIVGPDGTVYVAWSTLTSFFSAAPATINLVKSTNGGGTFGSLVTVASFTSTTGDLGSGGMSLRTRTFPYLAVDKTPSASPTHNNLYVVFQAQPGSAASPRSEIFFASSKDSGVTWSAPRNISSGPAVTIGADPTDNDNWMPSISVSPVSGHIKVLFYSRREDSANQKIRVYEAGSTDAGETWYNRPFSDTSFTPSVGYDPLLVSNYMGDYIYALADSSGLLGAWGDTRNLCAPPSGASAPCSPSGRGDQDAWSRRESDSTGVDLAITPWGFVTGVGPLWQTPDIFTVNSGGTPVNAEKGVVNRLRARIRNLGNAKATGAVVRFRYAPIYGSVPDSAFKLIGTVNVTVAAGATHIAPINWDLTNLSDTNGGIWPMPISQFDHFCVRVDITYPHTPGDINLSNNDAQNNFVDVSTGTSPLIPIRFLLGNPLAHPVRLTLVQEKLPLAVRELAKPAAIEMPAARLATQEEEAAVKIPLAEMELRSKTISLKENELQIATVNLTRPPASATEHLTEDLVVNFNSVVDGKIVGGFSVLLAKATQTAPKPAPSGQTSKETSKAVPQEPTQAKQFKLAVPVAPAEVHRSLAELASTLNLKLIQNDPQKLLISSSAVPLSHEELLHSITPAAQKLVPETATGRYFVTFKTAPAGPAGVTSSNVIVSTRILVLTPQDLDSPLGGRVVASNGSIEQKLLNAMSARFQLR
jgi:hypothetical protein